VQSLSASALQESFTITLGAQLKATHNLRLVAADPVDLMRFPPDDEAALPKRLQTAMSLYGANLAGVVLLTEGGRPVLRPNGGGSGLHSRFADICSRSTEFHFPTFEQQYKEALEDALPKALVWRREHAARQRALFPDEEDVRVSKYETMSNTLAPGDFVVTRHSNLCETHVVFHMANEAASTASSSINSRHPVVMGLRNVLRAASLSDVTSVTLPLLLTHAMSEEMTVAWCAKRAELVFKCVKGFMMEVASWGGSEIKTLQFAVPAAIDADVFARLTSMLATIFRTSNPIRGIS